ncbi:Leucine-rich repeat and guanylate kinase domain-containing protein [Collichthys lucidus]|uniref:Leucine-rich repeat and guanylate kinase domain-containing protein n=1 Tax=Collichthys lucidus TaxID=240159 RepID=A0A4U5VRI5_COLLU|nr:Leucine-rich repeat and guanylate kinase domain-containing protein [Collichthys lucidus]
MTETTSQQFAPPSLSSRPQGSRNDAEAPGYDELEESGEMEKDGFLTAEMVSSCGSNLRRIGTGLQHLSLPSHNLSDVSVLSTYVHIQKLELPHNKIKDLSCVSHMPYLAILDASHNEISNFFGFQPPKNLKEVNFSHNRMTKMEDLSAYSSLSKMDLGYNSFTEISGLEQCCNLSNLSLAHNKISKISGLGSLPLTHLCLHSPVNQPVSQPVTAPTQSFRGPAQSPTPTDSRPLPGNMLGKSRRGNQLSRIEGLENLKSLQVLDLSLNSINSLSGLQNLHLLGSINLEKNLISEIQEYKHIHDLFLLRDINVLGNPVQEQPDYRLAVIFLLQHLTVLDQEKVTAEEKVSSVNKYDPPLDVMAARDHMTHLVYQLMQPQVLYDSTLPSADSPYPMLVLTGPQGCGKRELAHRLCQDFSQYFAYGTCHTTRGPYFGEEDGIDYHYVSEEDFQNMIHMGKFIQTVQYGGHRYGLTRDAIEDVAREGLACCVHMELEGVLSLKNSYFEPRYILVIPTQVERYTGQLKRRDLYTPAQIDMAVSRIELYANTNRQRPGFFDNVIPCDDLEEAYQTLRQVVKEYLLLEEQEEGENNNRASPELTSTGHEPEEKPSSPRSRSGSGTVMSAAALDPSDPCYRNYFTNIQVELSPQKSPAELVSIRRREQLVREAIVGKSPGVYSQLFKSTDESRASSALSVPSSARALSGLVEPLDISVLGHALELGQAPEASHPGIDQQPVAVSPSSERRPGSNVKTILPPIPTGRRTPVVPTQASSPRPSQNPLTEEGGDADREG